VSDSAGETGAAERPLRILVVEDESMNRALLRAVLARSTDPRFKGATLLEADRLSSARKVMADGGVDLILLDVRLPDGSGLELARELAGGPAEGRPRIVILSASVLPMERAAAVEVGADAFLGKPYRPTELLDLLTQLAPPDGG
jgi:two-component system KDP operon response regulator KdpE